MTQHYGVFVESLVSILLLLTILYCVRLNNRLRLLRADEASLRGTIAELVTATQIAERAIAGLKSTMQDGEQALTGRLNRVEEVSAALETQIGAGEILLGKISRIAGAARVEEPPVADARSVAAAAQAFAERTLARLNGIAA